MPREERVYHIFKYIVCQKSKYDVLAINNPGKASFFRLVLQGLFVPSNICSKMTNPYFTSGNLSGFSGRLVFWFKNITWGKCIYPILWHCLDSQFMPDSTTKCICQNPPDVFWFATAVWKPNAVMIINVAFLFFWTGANITFLLFF